MIPASFDESNHVLDKPGDLSYDECEPLSVRVGRLEGTNYPFVLSCWKLTKEELELVNRTGRIWLGVMGHTMPPVTLTASPVTVIELEEKNNG